MGHKRWMGPLTNIVACCVLASGALACSGGKDLPDFGAALTTPPTRAADPVPVTTTGNARVDVDVDAGPRLDTASTPPPDAGETVPSGLEVTPGVFTRDVVARGFALAYERTPEIGVWASWINKIDQQKMPRITFLHTLVDAPEFAARFAGLSDGQFAVEVHQRFLHRAPSGDEIHGVQFLLSVGLSRAQVADRIVACPEFALATNPEHPYFF